MLFKITIMAIIAIFVDGTAPNQEPIYAVSSQSYHRGDVPLSYQYSAVHIYTTPKPTLPQQPYSYDQGNTKHSTIQYAPLAHNSFPYTQTYHEVAPEIRSQNRAEEGKSKKLKYEAKINNVNFLEPKNIEENTQNAHALKYRSYVPGNNIEVLPPHIVYDHDDVYHKLFQNQKVNIPKFIYKKIKEPLQPASDTYKGYEQTYLSEDDKVLYRFMAKPNMHNQPYIVDHRFKAKLPQLHLNIARIYGAARLPHQAPQIPPTHTQAIFSPLQPPNAYKTILYPVQDPRNNTPINTHNIVN